MRLCVNTKCFTKKGKIRKIRDKIYFIKVSPCFFTYNDIYTKQLGHSHRVMRDYAIKLHNNSVGTKNQYV